MSEDNDNTYYLKIRQNILRFAKKLETIDNVFLRDFSQYLQKIYKDEKRNEVSDSDFRMNKLEEFISHIYLLPKAPKEFQNKGCALLGKTPFDKLNFTKAFLENYGGLEYADDGVTHNRYAIIDCEGKAKKYGTLEKYARQYKNVPFVIFNNCENILKQKDTLFLFKHLCVDDRKLTFEDKDGKFKDYTAKSWYILLGNENKMHEILEKAQLDSREDVSYRINRFQYIIHIFDFDKEPSNVSNKKFNKFLQEAGIEFDEKGKIVTKSNEA